MEDLFQEAVAWFKGELQDHVSRQVKYKPHRRAPEEITLRATVGLTPIEEVNEFGVVVERRESRDFIIRVDDLKIGDTPVEPCKGDTIEETFTVGGVAVVKCFRVSSFGSEPPWRYSDRQRQLYRIHTKHATLENG